MKQEFAGRTLYGVMDFHFLVNTDVGLIRFIRDKFRDERAFNLSIVDKSDREILSLLYSKETDNPLEVITTEDNKENIGKLYDSFYKTYTKEIIDKSIVNKNIYNFIKFFDTFDRSIGSSLSICVSNKSEEEYIKSVFTSKVGIIYATDKIELQNKDPYYVQNISFFIFNKIYDVRLKTIYFAPTLFNLSYIDQIKDDFTSFNRFIIAGDHYQNIKKEKNDGKS